MKKWDSGDWIAFAVLALLLLGLAAWIASAIIEGVRQEQRVRECISGGYADAVVFNEVHLCIGVVDGAYTVEPLTDVQARAQ